MGKFSSIYKKLEVPSAGEKAVSKAASALGGFPPSFELWLKDKKKVFIKMSIPERVALKKQYELDRANAEKEETKKQKDLIAKETAAKLKIRTDKITAPKLDKLVKQWKHDSKKDFGAKYDEVVPDLAQSLINSNPGIKDFLLSKGIQPMFQQEYIADLLA